MKTRLFVVAVAAAVAVAAGIGQLRTHAAAAPLRVLLSVPPSQTTKPLDGRMLLLVSTDERTEPRFQVSDGDRTAQVFGVDVDGLAPGQDAVIDADVLGYPIRSLSDLAPGEYLGAGAAARLRDVQAVRRSHRQASARSRRRAAVVERAREFL